MSGSTGSRSIARLLVVIQVFLLVASLFAPMATRAADPSADPSPAPSGEPTPAPTPDPTAEPTAAPTPDPTATPAPDPTAPPVAEPTAPPTSAPTADPTLAPPPPFVPIGPASIASDQADYAPGSIVTLTGSNWQAGESVHIFVNDDFGSSWSRNTDVAADAQGQISDTFALPNWFVANYSVVATGAQSGTATASFTDGNVKFDVAPTGNTATFVEHTYSTTDCSGVERMNGGFPKTLTTSAGDTVGVGSSESLRIDAAALSDQGNTFSAWSSTSPFTVIVGTAGKSICIPGFGSGTRNYLATYAAVANRPPVADDETISTNEDTAVNTNVSVLLTGDTDADGDTLTVTGVSGATGGTAVLNDNGTPLNKADDFVTFTPTANLCGASAGGYDYTVSDGSASDTGHVTVNITCVNDAPVVSVDGAASVSESAVTEHIYTFDTTDPDAGDTFTAGTPDCGSGSFVAGSLVFSTTTGDGSFKCKFLDDVGSGPSNDTTVQITITDSSGETGNDSGTGSKIVTVNNVNPSVVVTGASPVNESQTAVQYTFDTTDPGTDTFSAGTPTCGASGSYVALSLVFSSVTGDGTFECLFADDNPTATTSDLSTVSITITDDDTGSGTGSKIVTVNDVAPTVSVIVSFNSFTQTATATATFTDPGWPDSHTAAFNWNVTGVQGPVVFTPFVNGTGTASNSIKLLPGCYPVVSVQAVITDDDTKSGTASGSVSGSADAFDIQFKAPIKDDERNLAKAGSVLPVKVVIFKSCPAGTTATDTSASLFLTIAQGAEGTESIDDTNVIVSSVSNADTGQQMRIADGFYIYNLSTKTLQSNADYTIRVRLGSTAGPVLNKAILRTYK